MKSEKYKEFLKRQAVKRPLHRNVSTEKISLKIPGENVEKTYGGGSSNILDSILLGKEINQSVTVDRRAASLLQYRLNVLEEKNLQMQRRIRLMKMVIILMAVVIFSLVIHLMLYFL